MTTAFIVALRPFLMLSKTLGLISISYTLESGLLSRNKSNLLLYYEFLELMRTIVLIVFTYVFHVNNNFLLRELVLLKFWTIIFMARVFEIWIIRLINGIIEFDRRLGELLPTTALQGKELPAAKHGWNSFWATLVGSYVGLQVFSMRLWPPASLNFITVVKYFFEIPCLMEFAVFVTSYFYLHSLGSRFGELNRFCERLLPAGLIAAAGTWTQPEITVLMDRVRQLHAELCDLLRVFGSGYGAVLFGYFAFNFVDLLRNFYYILHVTKYSSSNMTVRFNVLNVILTVTFCLQNVIFVLCILITTAWINQKKIEIVSLLRLIQISKLPFDTKLQVKMFMNQVSISEWDQISACGFFPVNLRLVISMCILLTTTLATSVQMKEHPYAVKFNNAYHSYLQLEYSNIE